MPEFRKVTVTDDDAITPDSFPVAEETREQSSDLACEVCGTPLVYRGTGRKPKRCEEHKTWKASSANSGSSRTGAGRGSSSVEQAIATLGNLYDLLGMGFFLADPQAAALWTANVTDLQTRNRAILSGDPELVKAINRLGVKGGKFAFAAVQFSAIAPPAIVAAQTMRQRSADKQAQAQAQNRRNSGAQTPPGSARPSGPTIPNGDFFG